MHSKLRCVVFAFSGGVLRDKIQAMQTGKQDRPIFLSTIAFVITICVSIVSAYCSLWPLCEPKTLSFIYTDILPQRQANHLSHLCPIC